MTLTFLSAGHALTIFQNHSTTSSDGLLHRQYHSITVTARYYLLSSIVGMLLPVVDINFRHTTNEQLQLSLVKHVDELLGDKLVESRHESVELFRDSSGDSVLGNEAKRLALPHPEMINGHSLDVILLVVLSDLDISSSILQVDGDEFTKMLFRDGKCVLDDIGDIVFQHPRQTSVKTGVDTFQVG